MASPPGGGQSEQVPPAWEFLIVGHTRTDTVVCLLPGIYQLLPPTTPRRFTDGRANDHRFIYFTSQNTRRARRACVPGLKGTKRGVDMKEKEEGRKKKKKQEAKGKNEKEREEKGEGEGEDEEEKEEEEEVGGREK